MRVLVIGDTHGNTPWVTNFIYPIAVCLKADRIVQVGDFGFWEHAADGVAFLDAVDCAGHDTGIPLYALRGNHDKSSRVIELHGHDVDDEGFVRVRDNLLYIPDGHAWTWQGRTFRAFGGAYSVDKAYRLDLERSRYEKAVRKEEYRASAANRQPAHVPSTTGTLWFPEEEMTDADMAGYLAADSSPKDFILSHDKPRSSNPGWNRKDILECWANQDRLQSALLAHKPRYWLHGHLHWYYQDTVHSGDDTYTTVVGLEPDDNAAEFGWRRDRTYAVIDLDDDGSTLVRMGFADGLEIDRDQLRAAQNALY